MSEKQPDKNNPCQACGACCAAYRVSFYWSEADETAPPVELTEQVNPWLSCMAGTNSRSPRCVALEGRIGQAVTCGIYEKRPSPCRELQPGEENCNKARLRHGLLPLPPKTADDRYDAASLENTTLNNAVESGERCQGG